MKKFLNAEIRFTKRISRLCILVFLITIISCSVEEEPEATNVSVKEIYTEIIKGLKVNRTKISEESTETGKSKSRNKQEQSTEKSIVGIHSVYGYYDWEIDSIFVDTIRTYSIVDRDTTYTDSIVPKDTISSIINAPSVIPYNQMYGGTQGFILRKDIIDTTVVKLKISELSSKMDFFTDSIGADGFPHIIYPRLDLSEDIIYDFTYEHIDSYRTPYIIDQYTVGEFHEVEHITIFLQAKEYGIQTFKMTATAYDGESVEYIATINVLPYEEYREWYGFTD